MREIPCDENFEIDLDALRTAIKADRANGKIPFAVIGTVGAVNVGAIDDLDGPVSYTHLTLPTIHLV